MVVHQLVRSVHDSICRNSSNPVIPRFPFVLVVMKSHGTYSTSTTNTVDLSILKDILSAMYDSELVSAVEEQIDDEQGANTENNLQWKEELSCKPWVYHMDPELQWRLKSVTEHDSYRDLTQNNVQFSTSTTSTASLQLSKPCSAQGPSVAFYPTWTFLDLREVQNHKFAQDRFMQGINYAREKQYDKAESCYKEVLNLMPFHADCLVAYGALCASSTSMSRHDGSISTKVLDVVDDNDDRLSKAEAMLQRAIEIDPQCANAHKYLDQIAVARQRQETSKSQQLTSNVQLLPQKALNDAITERAILYGDQDETSNTLQNELVATIGVTDEQCWREQKNRRHRKKKKKKHRQRKRYDSDVSSSYSSSSVSVDNHSNLSYPSHKKKRKKTTHGSPKRKHNKKKSR